MAPLMDDENGHINGSRSNSTSKPRLAIIGAGSRGNAYARATVDSGLGTIETVVEPIDFKRNLFGSTYIWQRNSKPSEGSSFTSWQDFIIYEGQRRRDEAAGKSVANGVDGVFVCVRDELHCRVVTSLAPLGLHIMCEKPLATTLKDCLQIQDSLQSYPQHIFAIGHVLRYSPHNMLLRDLVLNRKVVGDVCSIEHTEPVGWWHFSHSYVRGNWRKEKVTAPSLLTKSCHDIDWLLWMLCDDRRECKEPHLPSHISSTGSLKQFRKARKPKEAGDSTNCLKCPLVDSCMYSAKHIYNDLQLAKGNAKWPVEIVNPEIETLVHSKGPAAAKQALMTSLSEDYDKATPVADIESRPWFGRCVWESDNDVCDDQHVTIAWDDDEKNGRWAKSANFHMIAQTAAQCERRGFIYGTEGEIHYDSKSITVTSFKNNNEVTTYNPEVPKNSHHGGGDDGLTQQFVKAVAAVKEGRMEVQDAQVEFMGVTLEEAVRSHAAVFAAEEARREKKVVEWREWWERHVGS